jgi:hypothetical protein
VLYWGMIKSPHLLQEIDRRHERAALADLSYDVALQRFAALWAEARELGAIDNGDWLTDLKPDLAIARILNGLPPAA